MQLLSLLIVSVFASKEKEHIAGNSELNILEDRAQNEILVKIEEDEFVIKKSDYIGVIRNKRDENWRVSRWSKKEKKAVYNGYYSDEVTAACASDTLARKLVANGEKNHSLNFPDEDTEVWAEITSNYTGVTHRKNDAVWSAQRWSKKENKVLYYGTSYNNEETAAHASDTLARKLIANGEKGHKLNFPDNGTDVSPKTKTSNYIGVSYSKESDKWRACRHSKNEGKNINWGCFKDEKTAARASDTLARKFTANGGKGYKLNFPDDVTEVYPEKKTYIGVSYHKHASRWTACRWSKIENKVLYNGLHKDEETAAHASDTLGRKLVANGEKGHKLNFPNDATQVEVRKYKRKRPVELRMSETNTNLF